MSKITIRPATAADAKYVEDHLRAADFEEFVMAGGRHPHGRLVASVMQSEDLSVGLLDGRPACVFGVIPLREGAAPWMLGTDLIAGRRVARFLVRHGRHLFRAWAAKYGELQNYVYAPNELHIRYIEALGCEVAPQEPAGALRAPFRKFVYRCAAR